MVRNLLLRSTLASTHGLRAGEFFAVKDVSFELRRGELRALGRSEKEISEKCLGATKVPDSGRSRHQCLGLIGHNGAGNQAAGQPLGPRQRGPLLGRLLQSSPQGETPWEGANQHDAVEDAEWVDQAGRRGDAQFP